LKKFVSNLIGSEVSTSRVTIQYEGFLLLRVVPDPEMISVLIGLFDLTPLTTLKISAWVCPKTEVRMICWNQSTKA